MKNNIVFTIVILMLLISNVICVVFLSCMQRETKVYQSTIDSLEKDNFKYVTTLDSLNSLDIIRFDNECFFYGMREEYVLSVLPKPLFTNDVVVTLKDAGMFWPMSIELFLTRDSVINPTRIHQHVWNNPFSNRNRLDISFVKKDSIWIAVACLEYDTTAVIF